MKKSLWFVGFIFILVTVLTACQTAATDQAPVETAYPVETGSKPNQENEQTIAESAYPISEEDLQNLYQTWSLTQYTEDGIVKDTQSKTIAFAADGTYQMTTEQGSTSGAWTSTLLGLESSLVIDPDSDQPLTYEIIALDRDLLTLRSVQDNLEIEEQFQPAN